MKVRPTEPAREQIRRHYLRLILASLMFVAQVKVKLIAFYTSSEGALVLLLHLQSGS